MPCVEFVKSYFRISFSGGDKYKGTDNMVQKAASGQMEKPHKHEELAVLYKMK